MVLDLGDPDLPVWIVEVEAGVGEALRAGALHAQAVALLAIVGHDSHLVLLEPFGELPFFLCSSWAARIASISVALAVTGRGVEKASFGGTSSPPTMKTAIGY
jgi:hypothetical protein